jgi:hypothetical protein
MAESNPTLDEWRRLYEAFIRTKEIAPWEWMTETDIFGVQDPETDEIGFVSVMGILGEHLALAVYRGAEGLYSFWAFEEMPDDTPPEAILNMPHLQASFEDRGELTNKDRELIKQLGLRFRGRQAWPMFRSYRPGYLPWYLERQEVRSLTYALEQAAEVALRFKEDPALLEPIDEESYLIRVPRQVEGELVWEDKIMRVPPPEPEEISVVMDLQALEYVKQLPQGEHTLEADLSVFPVHIQERAARPYMPHMLLIVESESGFILRSELLEPSQGLMEIWGSVPMQLVHQLANLGTRPREIRVRSFQLFALIQLLAQELGFEVKQSARLRSLERARQSLLHRLS